MTHSLITRLLQISPAVAAVVFLASFVGGGQGGRGRRGGDGWRDSVGDERSTMLEVALVTDVPSHEGRYVASLAPAERSAWDGSEGWTISLRDANGNRVEGASLAVEAWQPDETDAAWKSATAESLGAGQYRVDAMTLGSSGWWNVKLAVAGVAADSLAFNVVLR